MQNILLVEDTKAVSSILKIILESVLQLNIILAETYTEAKQIIEKKENNLSPMHEL